MGESNANHEIRRADWMHIIRAQAFSNLWGKALKAHEGGLIVVKATGTDELHVIGDWRSVFSEGRGVSDMKAKGETYTLGGGK
ncbi:acyltransferase [Streptomyces sp. NRRL S-495]|nr:acyltransferase [Streptomyces sp. NRRL S-495]